MYFVIEEQRYNNTWGFSDEIINFLAAKRIIEIHGEEIKFTYVGFIIHEQTMLFVAPKIYDEKDINIRLMKTIRKVIKKSCNNNKNDDSGTDFIQTKKHKEYYGEMAVADFLISDYLLHGGYRKVVSKTVTNLEKVDDWKSTINTVIPFFSDGHPVYSETYSKVLAEDNESEIVRLYVMILSYFLSKYSLVLGYEGIALNKHRILKSPFSDRRKQKYYLNLINDELSGTFKDRDIQILKAMRYLFKKDDFYNQKQLSLYGTIKFDRVWEKCLQSIFDNESDDYSQYNPNPIWRLLNGSSVTNSSNQMRPDIIHKVDDKILLFDAKYYNIKLSEKKEKKSNNNPGSYDIVKQYVYQLALESGKFQILANALIFPEKLSEDVECEIFATVSLPLFKRKDILCIYYSVDYAFNWYLTENKYTTEEYTDLIKKLEDFYSNYKPENDSCSL